MSISGDRNIIKNSSVNAGFADEAFHESATGLDYLDCSRITLSRVSFQLEDTHGNTLDLNGAHILLSIVFSRAQDATLNFPGSYTYALPDTSPRKSKATAVPVDQELVRMIERSTERTTDAVQIADIINELSVSDDTSRVLVEEEAPNSKAKRAH